MCKGEREGTVSAVRLSAQPVGWTTQPLKDASLVMTRPGWPGTVGAAASRACLLPSRGHPDPRRCARVLTQGPDHPAREAGLLPSPSVHWEPVLLREMEWTPGAASPHTPWQSSQAPWGPGLVRSSRLSLIVVDTRQVPLPPVPAHTAPLF